MLYINHIYIFCNKKRPYKQYSMEVIILSISLLFIGITITKNIEKHFLLSLAALILLAIITIMIIFSI